MPQPSFTLRLWLRCVPYTWVYYHSTTSLIFFTFSRLPIYRHETIFPIVWSVVLFGGATSHLPLTRLRSLLGSFLLYSNAYSMKLMFSMFYVFGQNNIEPTIGFWI